MGRGDVSRLTRRKATKKQPGHKTFSIWMLILCFFFLAGSFVFLRSPFFEVESFEIIGNQKVSSEEIISRIGQKGVNIFAFDLDKAQKAIEASPFIEEAVCKRKFPNKIIVTVKERTPIAFVPVNEKSFLIDGEGRVLGEDDGSFPSLIGFTGVSGTLTPGQFLDQSMYGWGLEVLSHLGASGIKATEVNVQDGDCTLILEDGCRVFLGKEEKDIMNLLGLLKSILSDLEKDGNTAEYIDLRFDKPSVKLRSYTGR